VFGIAFWLIVKIRAVLGERRRSRTIRTPSLAIIIAGRADRDLAHHRRGGQWQAEPAAPDGRRPRENRRGSGWRATALYLNVFRGRESAA